jgi:hypothetical protein
VTLSFVLILLPLLVLAWQAWQSLNALSAQAAHINRTTLVDARRSEAMINAALEMERSYRQYCVLDDPTLARVYQNQRQRYSQMLDAHAGVLPDEKLWQALRQDVSDLAQLQCKNSGPMPRQPPDWKFSPVITAIWCRRPGRSSILAASSCSRRLPNAASFSAGRRWCCFC